MNRKTTIISSLLFVLIIFSVGIIQALYELGTSQKSEKKKGNVIQILDVLEDTFITPGKRAGKIDSSYQKVVSNMNELQAHLGLLLKPDSNSSDLWSIAEEKTEDVKFALVELKNNVQIVNRHRQLKTTAVKTTILDSMAGLIENLFNRVLDQEEPSGIKEDLSQLAQKVNDQKKTYTKKNILHYPFLVVKHFIFYTIFNREYLRKYETEMEETSIFANSMRPYMQFFRYITIRDWGEKALQGRNDWLFYKQGFQYLIRPNINDPRSFVVDPEDTPIRDNIIDTILAFQDELQKHGCKLLVVIVPGKASIYPDLLSSRIAPEKSGTFGHSLKLMSELEKHGVATVDLFTALSEARQNDHAEGDSLYLKQDTHWHPRGVRVVAKTVADNIKKRNWHMEFGNQVEYMLDTITVNREGDIKVMANLPDFKLPFLKMPFIIEPVKCSQVFTVKRDEYGTLVGKPRLFKDNYRQAKIMVLGDSFSRIYQNDQPRSAGWISHLAYELSVPVCSFISDGGASTLVREKLARKVKLLKGKKLVVWEFVERDIRYGAEGWRDIKLMNK